jgi:hypothetical protein
MGGMQCRHTLQNIPVGVAENSTSKPGAWRLRVGKANRPAIDKHL